MIGHRHHLVENGTMLSCDSPGCPTKGKPVLLAGGDAVPVPCGGGVPFQSEEEKIAVLEMKVKKLQEEMDELKGILARKGFFMPRHGC